MPGGGQRPLKLSASTGSCSLLSPIEPSRLQSIHIIRVGYFLPNEVSICFFFRALTFLFKYLFMNIHYYFQEKYLQAFKQKNVRTNSILLLRFSVIFFFCKSFKIGKSKLWFNQHISLKIHHFKFPNRLFFAMHSQAQLCYQNSLDLRHVNSNSKIASILFGFHKLPLIF